MAFASGGSRYLCVSAFMTENVMGRGCRDWKGREKNMKVELEELEPRIAPSSTPAAGNSSRAGGGDSPGNAVSRGAKPEPSHPGNH